MRTMRKASAAITVLVAAVLLCPLVAGAATNLGVISGKVQDSGGVPVVGAVVIATAASSFLPERIALTGREGQFSILNLLEGQYTVKVSMPRFLTALRQGVQLSAGGTTVLTVNLQNAMDIVRRSVVRDKPQSDDIIWTLRSSTSTQPVLRLVQGSHR